MSSRLSKLLGKCLGESCQNNKVTKINISPAPLQLPRRLLSSYRSPSAERKVPENLSESEDNYSETNFDDEYHVQSSLEANIKKRVNETINFTSPENFEPQGIWKCEPHLRLCIPQKTSTSATYGLNSSGMSTTYDTSKDYQWSICQAKCGTDYNHSDRPKKWQRSIFLDARQHFFLTTMLKNLVDSINSPMTLSSPLSSPLSPTEVVSTFSSSSPTKISTSDHIDTPYTPPTTAGEITMAIRIIFSLAAIPPEKMSITYLEDILMSIVNLDWPPMYKIALLLGISKEQIFYATTMSIDARLLPVIEVKNTLEKNLRTQILNHKTIENMKVLKLHFHEYLLSHIKFVDIVTLIGGKPTMIYKKNKDKLRVVFDEVKNLCRELVVCASRILPESETAKLDTFIMNGRKRIGHDSLDPMALDIAITIRLTAKEITNLILAFSSRAVLSLHE